jgi:hypothetical protein
MPDYFSHNILAQQIYDKLDKSQREQIPSRTLYLLGAQGGDVFFFYTLRKGSKNVGGNMHRLDPCEFFSKLAQTNKSYCAGFATHYAADCTLHPAVYAFEATQRTHMSHFAFENDIGLYCSRRYSLPRKILPRDEVLQSTSCVYDCMKKIYDSLTLTGVERCLKRHCAYMRFVFNHKRNSYKYDYDFSSLNGALDDAIALGLDAVKCVLDGNIDKEVFKKSFLEH